MAFLSNMLKSSHPRVFLCVFILFAGFCHCLGSVCWASLEPRVFLTDLFLLRICSRWNERLFLTETKEGFDFVFLNILSFDIFLGWWISRTHLSFFGWHTSRSLLNFLSECRVEQLYVNMVFTKVFYVSVFSDALMSLFFGIKLYFSGLWGWIEFFAWGQNDRLKTLPAVFTG